MGWILPVAQLGISAYGMYKASQDDPAKRQQEYMRQLYNQYFSPSAMAQGTNQAYNYWKAGPAYQNSYANLISAQQRNPIGPLGAGGIGDTRALLKGMSFAPALGQLQQQGYQQAQNSYMQGAQMAMQGGMSMPQPSFGAPQMAGSILNALSQYGTLNPKQTTTPTSNQMYSPQNQVYYGSGVPQDFGNQMNQMYEINKYQLPIGYGFGR